MEKTEEQIKKEAMDNIREVATKSATEKVAELKEEFAKFATKEEIGEAKKANQETNEKLTKLSVYMKKQGQMTVSTGTLTAMGAIKKSLEQTIRDNADVLKKYRSGTLGLTVKAISQTSFGATDYASLTTERLPLYRSPYAPVYLRNVFPNISTSSANLAIWKQNTVTGKAAIWERGKGDGGVDTDKPEVTPTWKKEVVSVDWIAGITHIPKEILEDVDFMATEIPYALIYGASGILAAENKMILDYIAKKAVDFTLPDDVDAFEDSLESILAAAYGQLGDNYMAPTHILINNWDYLKFLAFNKASGSGQYNYPNLTLTFANNQMFINNLQAVPATGVAPATAYVVSADHSRFVSRQGLQMDMSESHSDNFTKNMVTYRAEVRSGFFTYNNNSFVKVTLPTPAVETPAE